MPAAGVDELVAAMGAIATDIEALPPDEAGQLFPLVQRHAWPLLKALLADPTWRQKVVARHGLHLLTFLLASLLKPKYSWYPRCSYALDAAHIILAVLGDASATPNGDTAQHASEVLVQANTLVHTNIDGEHAGRHPHALGMRHRVCGLC
jgi:hypothetical protein